MGNRMILAGKTCNTMATAKRFVDSCSQSEISNRFWFNSFETETGGKILVTLWVDALDVNALNEISSTIILHRKPTGTMFTINALNKLAEQIKKSNPEYKDLDTKDIRINWDDYRGKLICVFNKELKIYNLRPLHEVRIQKVNQKGEAL